MNLMTVNPPTRNMQDPIKYAEQIAYSSKKVVHFTAEMAKKYKDVTGVYVECGVAAGAQIIAMAHSAPDKIIYAFDSFEGIALPSNRDDQMPGIRRLKEWEQKALPDPGKQVLTSSGATIVSLGDFRGNLQIVGLDKSNIIAVVGWFENTVPFYAEEIEEIALLRLDGDLYNSTWVCLQHLFPKVIKGGCVIVDDWQLKGCQDACKEYFALIGYEPDYKFLDGTAFFYK
jgi:O-methyltransferase